MHTGNLGVRALKDRWLCIYDRIRTADRRMQKALGPLAVAEQYILTAFG